MEIKDALGKVLNVSRIGEAVIVEMKSLGNYLKAKEQSAATALILLLEGINPRALNEQLASDVEFFIETSERTYELRELGNEIAGLVQKGIRQRGLDTAGPNVNPAIWNLINASSIWWEAWGSIFAGEAASEAEALLK
jgi:hypothetical protein